MAPRVLRSGGFCPLALLIMAVSNDAGATVAEQSGSSHQEAECPAEVGDVPVKASAFVQVQHRRTVSLPTHHGAEASSEAGDYAVGLVASDDAADHKSSRHEHAQHQKRRHKDQKSQKQVQQEHHEKSGHKQKSHMQDQQHSEASVEVVGDKRHHRGSATHTEASAVVGGDKRHHRGQYESNAHKDEKATRVSAGAHGHTTGHKHHKKEQHKQRVHKVKKHHSQARHSTGASAVAGHGAANDRQHQEQRETGLNQRKGQKQQHLSAPNRGHAAGLEQHKQEQEKRSDRKETEEHHRRQHNQKANHRRQHKDQQQHRPKKSATKPHKNAVSLANLAKPENGHHSSAQHSSQVSHEGADHGHAKKSHQETASATISNHTDIAGRSQPFEQLLDVDYQIDSRPEQDGTKGKKRITTPSIHPASHDSHHKSKLKEGSKGLQSH